MSTPITPIEGTNNIRYADFVRVVTATATYYFSTYAASLTVSEISSTPFDGLGALVAIGKIQRDIKSTGNQTSIEINGIDSSLLGWALGQNIKGSQITMWKGFFNPDGSLITSGGTGGLYQYFYGFIDTFQITEKWQEEIRMYTGTISVSAANIQLILQNRVAGRYTNDSSWQFFNSGDTSMKRVAQISTIYYAFGAPAGTL
jgi:hypothetical protein